MSHSPAIAFQTFCFPNILGTFPFLKRLSCMSRAPTIHDVARIAGVSKSTVSRVMQGAAASVADETRRNVLEAMNSVGYSHNAVASSLRTSRSMMVMLLIPSIDNPFWPGIARSLQITLAEAGYAVVFANTDWNGTQERSLLDMARRNRFDAIALNPAAISPAQLRALGVPAVVLGLRAEYEGIDMVGSDSYQGTHTALEYLYAKGHRRIGFIWGEPRASHSRHRAYMDFFNEHGMLIDPTLIAGSTYSVEGGRIATHQLMQQAHPPTAIFASNDVMALAAIQEITALGLNVPNDVSVMGMDDIEPASMSTPPLTTIAKDKYALGRKAAELLLHRLDHTAPPTAQRIVVPCTLIERQTVAPPRVTLKDAPP